MMMGCGRASERTDAHDALCVCGWLATCRPARLPDCLPACLPTRMYVGSLVVVVVVVVDVVAFDFIPFSAVMCDVMCDVRLRCG